MRRLIAPTLAVIALLSGILVAPAASAVEQTVVADAATTVDVEAALDAETAIGDSIQTADLSKFQAGNIVSDTVFFASGTMTEAEIQAFLEKMVPTCQSGYTCLKDWYDTSRSTTADAMCGAYSGGTRERASRIIYKVAQACGINPQVILVTLQKEQGLVNHVWPSDWRYRIAMGQGCPDTAACDSRYYGFFNQVYGAAWQFKRYANPAGTSQYFTWYAPGKTWNILWNPDHSCGSSPVYVQNQATANLYYYTPYQPNAAAIRAGYGTGDGCSSYGNRNFYQYFTDWFGSTQVVQNACKIPASSRIESASGEYVTTAGALNARTVPSTMCDDGTMVLSSGTTVTRTGTYGEWWRVRIDGATRWVHSDYLTEAPAPTYETSRISGTSRYDTAVEISRSTYPGGADTLFLASGTEYPDALAAGAAAGAVGGALLLTEQNALREAVAEEIVRLAVTDVVIVGAEDRVSTAVAERVAELVPAADVRRIAGIDRYETSELIAETFFASATNAYVATGENYPDAVAAAALGAALNRPVLLVRGSDPSLDEQSMEWFRTSMIGTVSLAGSTSTVSGQIGLDIRELGITVTRYGGRDRYETSRLLAAAAYRGGSDRAILATGQNFPDALTGAVLAAAWSAPLFTTQTGCLDYGTKDWLLDSGVGSVTLLGGTPSLSAAVASSVRC